MVKDKPVQAGQGVIYKWRGGGGFNVPAQVVGEELARMEVKPGDYHKATDVLEAARHPDCPLHGCFPWDDEKAAEQMRLDVARRLIRSIAVVIVRDERREVVPVYCHLTDEQGPRYVRADRVASDEEMKQRAMDEALALLNGIRKRYDFIAELSPVFEAINIATERAKRKKKRRRRKAKAG